MKLCLALIRADKTDGVMRGSPEDISTYVGGLFVIRGGKCNVLCSVEDEVTSAPEEYNLWKRLITKAAEIGQQELAESKLRLWLRKGGWVWDPAYPDRASAFYVTVKDRDSLILSIPGEPKQLESLQ